MNAETIAAKIRANVEALYANSISFEEFSATNFALWDAATAAWYGRAPMLEVWADRPADGFTPFSDVARAFAASMGVSCSQ